MFKFSKLFLLMFTGFLFACSSAYAMHSDSPIVFARCKSMADARAIIDTYAASVKGGESLTQFNTRMKPFAGRCTNVSQHVADIEPGFGVEAILQNATPPIWSGPMLAGVPGGWSYLSWHIGTGTARKGTPEETTYYLVFIKKRAVPESEEKGPAQ